MTGTDLLAYLPVVILAVDSLLVLLAVAAFRGHAVPFALTLAGTAAGLASLPVAWSLAPRRITGLLAVDGFGLFSVALILGATFCVALLAFPLLRERKDERGEFYFLLLLASLGGSVLSTAGAFATLFLGMDLMGISLYALIAYRRESHASTEAGIKYLMLAGTASAFYLFGMAVIYADTGTMDLAQVAAAVGKPGLLVPVGLALIIVGLGFKLSVVPFHLWTPDVYDGAPAPVTAFIASVSKGATAVLLARFLLPAIGGPTGALFWTFAVISVASMFLGNILALREDNIKRILAYSSIAHLGYLLIGFLSGGPDAVRAISFYLLAYFITIIACFAVVAGLSRTDREANRLEDYRGLASRRPWLAGAFTAGLLSLAGLPLTAGFVGKFIIVAAGAGAALWILAVILAVNSTISIFYYLRVVSAMFRPPEPAMAGLLAGETGGAAAVRVPFLAGLTVAALTLAVIALGIYPSPVLRVIGLFAGG